MEENEIKKLAGERRLPFYLFDGDEFLRRIEEIRSRLPEKVLLAYAVKANPFLAETAAEATDRLEICSFGEYRICRERQIPPEKMLISGVLKKEEEFLQILEECRDGALYTAESRNQYEILDRWTRENRTDAHLYLRLTSGNQFGMDEEALRRILSENRNEFLHIDGIHYFSGTQKRTFQIVYEELERVFEISETINRQLGAGIETIEFGPGFRVDYFEKKGVFPPEMSVSEKEWQQFSRLLEEKSGQFRIRLEMGRFMAATCGCYATRILDEKLNEGVSYAIVDGGIHQMNYDGQIKGMYKPGVLHIRGRELAGADAEAERAKAESAGNAAEETKHVGAGSAGSAATEVEGMEAGSTGSAAEETKHVEAGSAGSAATEVEGMEAGLAGSAANETSGGAGEASAGTAGQKKSPWTVCGSLCTVNDVLVKNLELDSPEAGDWLVFMNAGAYAVTEGMALFLSHELPEVFFYSTEKGLLPLRTGVETYIYNQPFTIGIK